MVYTKKIISTSALLIASATIMSSVSAMSMTSSDEGSSMSSGSDDSQTQSTTVDNTTTKMDPYGQCLAYVKLKNLTGVDCKAKAEAMRQENRSDRTQMNQEIRTDRDEMRQENKDNRQQTMSGMVRTPGVPGGELGMFFKNPLSTEEKTAFKTLMDAHIAAREAVMKDSTLTAEQKVTKITALMTQHFTDLLPYVATDKQAEFKEATAKMLAMIAKNVENRQDFREGAKEKRQDYKEQVKVKKQVLSTKLLAQLTAIVEKLPLEKLNKVLANVDKAVAKIQASTLTQEKKDRTLAQLAEIKAVVQAQVDTLSGNNPDANLLNEVLNGVADGSGSTTVTQ